MRRSPAIGLLTVVLLASGSASSEAHRATHRHLAHHISVPRRQVGKASIYSSRLQGRHMSDGQRFNVASDDAASKTLPLGTKARVTNLSTGKSAEVTIKDRGPVPAGRVVDLTPHTAAQIGLTRKEGLAPVVVVPTSLPATVVAAARP